MKSLKEFIFESCNIVDDDLTNEILDKCFGYNHVAPDKDGFVRIAFKHNAYKSLFEDAKLECKDENLVEAIEMLLKNRGFDDVSVEAQIKDTNMGGKTILVKFEQK